MAAHSFHRKIIEAPANTTEICILRCDPLKPLLNCTADCNTTDSSPPWPSLPLPLPLTPPPTDDYYIFSTPPKHHHSSLSLSLKISLVILVLTFSFFLLYTLYKFYTVWYQSRRRRSPPSPPSPENQETHDEFLDHDVLDHPIWYIRTIGLQPSVISAITVVKYNKTDGLIDGTYCTVCLSDFQEEETLRLLPKCNHAFHISCIDTWLRSHTNCPLCRAGIVKNTTTSSSSGQNLDYLGQIEETQISIQITDDANGEQGETEDDNQNSDLTIGVVGNSYDEENKGETNGGSGTSDLLFMRRSVSLNDYAACRIRSDMRNNNNYYSDRHEVQIRSIYGDSGFQLVKVDRTANNRPMEVD